MHVHDWKPKYESRIPIVNVPYTLMICECDAEYPVPAKPRGL